MIVGRVRVPSILVPAPITVIDDSGNLVVVDDAGGKQLIKLAAFTELAGLALSADIMVGLVAHPCYSGSSGSAYVVKPSTTQAVFVVPPLPIGGPYDVRITHVVNGIRRGILLTGGLQVVARNWHSNTFSLRSAFSPLWYVGPRSLDQIGLLT